MHDSREMRRTGFQLLLLASSVAYVVFRCGLSAVTSLDPAPESKDSLYSHTVREVRRANFEHALRLSNEDRWTCSARKHLPCQTFEMESEL